MIESKQNKIHTKKGIIAIRKELKAIRVFRKFDSFSIVAPATFQNKQKKQQQQEAYGWRLKELYF